MSKTLVGKVKNEKFAFFWLLIGGSLGNILIVLFSLDVWPVFLPCAIMSILIAMIMFDKLKRPKILLGIDLLLSAIPFILIVTSLVGAQIELAAFLPGALIIFGCVLGIMDW
jgi:hypothetical protein